MNNKKPSSKPIIWIFSIIFLIVILLVSFPYLASTFFGEDDTIFNDEDLILTEANIEESENSYFDLIKLSRVLADGEILEAEVELKIPEYINDLNYLESYNWDSEIVEELLNNNEEALKIFDEAGNKSQFQFNITSNPENIKPEMPVTDLRTWISVSKINAIKAIYLMKEGKEEVAFSEAMKIIKIGSDIEKSRNIYLTAYIVGLDIEKIGLETINILYENSSQSIEILSNIKEKIQEYKITNNKDPFVIEYMIFKKAVETSAINSIENSLDLNFFTKRLLNHKYYYKQIKTLNIVADYYHRVIEKFNTCDDKISTIRYKPQINWKTYFTENAIGEILANTQTVGLDRIINKKCDIENLMNSTEELFTLRK